ncbi:IclR family transcriptional regulator [Brevibacterium samyangense]|uniref:IclR family transcriptional regulator n=1 Tax=Brevibacterium samyangense TaxID=366888 RepID=A0ABN2TF61_9MICO
MAKVLDGSPRSAERNTRGPGANAGDGTAQTLRRSAALVHALAQGAPAPMSLATLAGASGLAKSTVHRLLAGLVSIGWVARSGSDYLLSATLVRIGEAARATHPADAGIRAALGRITAATGETAFHSVLEGTSVVCTHRREGTGPIRNTVLQEGDVHPLGVGAGSLAILAALPEAEATRAREANLAAHGPDSLLGRLEADGRLAAALAEARELGYALNPGLVVPASWALGVPVFDAEGRPTAALSLGSIEQHLGPDRRPELVRILTLEATRLSKETS